jgi:hypothetical protein
MNTLLHQHEPNCEKLADYAFDSHVECYLHPAPNQLGFCQIFLNNFEPLFEIYDLKDFILQPIRSIKQVFKHLNMFFDFFLSIFFSHQGDWCFDWLHTKSLNFLFQNQVKLF